MAERGEAGEEGSLATRVADLVSMSMHSVRFRSFCFVLCTLSLDSITSTFTSSQSRGLEVSITPDRRGLGFASRPCASRGEISVKLERKGSSMGSVNRLVGVHSREGGEVGAEKFVTEEVGLESEISCSVKIPRSSNSKGSEDVWLWSSERNMLKTEVWTGSLEVEGMSQSSGATCILSGGRGSSKSNIGRGQSH